MRVAIFASCLVTFACTALAQIPDEIKLRLQETHTNTEFLEIVKFNRRTAARNSGITKLKIWMADRRVPPAPHGPENGRDGDVPGIVRPTRVRPGGVTDRPGRNNILISNRDVFEGDTGVLTAEAKEALIAEIPQAPLCEPRPTTIPVPLAADPSEFYWPSCVSMDRCGGCCSQGQACVPKRTETITLPIMKINHNDGGIAFQDVVQMNFERHVACGCDCPVKESHCDPEIHDYVQSECRCKCKNEAERSQCSASGKTFNPERCTCGCPVKLECSVQEIFSMETCTCETLRHRSRNIARASALGADAGTDVVEPVTEEPPSTSTTAETPTTASAPLTWAQRKQKCRREMTCPRGKFGFPTRSSTAKKPCYCRPLRRNTRTGPLTTPDL